MDKWHLEDHKSGEDRGGSADRDLRRSRIKYFYGSKETESEDFRTLRRERDNTV